MVSGAVEHRGDQTSQVAVGVRLRARRGNGLLHAAGLRSVYRQCRGHQK